MTDKTSVADWSTTPDDNDNIAGILLGENKMRPSDVNGAIRTMMAQVAAGIPSASGGISFAADRTALAEIDSSKNSVAWLEESGRQGVFQWNSADLSAEVTADTQQGIYVAPSSDPTGASGAWVRVVQQRAYDPRWFGAVGDGTTDDTTAFQAALNLAAVTGIGAVYVPGECTFFLSQITLPDRIELFGNQWHQEAGSTAASVLKFSITSGRAIIEGLDSYKHNLTITNTTGSTNSSTCVFSGNTASAVYITHNSPNEEYIYFSGWYVCHEIGSGGCYYFKSRCVEFEQCCYGHRVTGTNAPYNISIDTPKSSLCQIFIDAVAGSEPRNIKIIGGSIEDFTVIAQNFQEISISGGTYVETPSTATCFAAITPINGGKVVLSGMLVYMNGIARFVNVSGLSCSLSSEGNRFVGQPASGSTVFYLPAATSTVSLKGDDLKVDSGYEANLSYTTSASVAFGNSFDITYPYMTTAYAQASVSKVKITAGLGYFPGIVTAAPTSPITNMIYTADGSGWDPLSKSGGPYQVIRRASSYAGLSG